MPPGRPGPPPGLAALFQRAHPRGPHVAGWIAVEKRSGREAVEKTWLDTLDGRANPRVGYVLSI